MFLQRSAIAAARRAVVSPVIKRSFTSSFVRRAPVPSLRPDPSNSSPGSEAKGTAPKEGGKIIKFEDVKEETDLLGPGAVVGSIPTDLEQATGLERFEILGKMQGIDVFDMKPLDASRRGTLEDPIVVKSAGDEQYCGCTGSPADSHVTIWLTMSRDRPIERCPECGSVYKMDYVGPMEDPHAHDHHDSHDAHGDHHAPYEEPKTFADFVKPEYR